MPLSKIKTAAIDSIRVTDLDAPFSMGRKNLLDNGEFHVWQRYFSSSNHSGKGPHDRWRTNYNDCVGNYTRQQDAPISLRWSLEMLKSGSSNGSMSTQQNLEFDQAMALRGKYITFSVYAKAVGTTDAAHKLSLSFGLFRQANYNSWANNANGSTEDGFYAKSFFFDGRAIDTTTQGANSNSAFHIAHTGSQLTTSWQRFSITLGPIPTTTQTIIPQIFSEGTAQNGGIRVSGAQVEAVDLNHTDPTAFEQMSFTETLTRCQTFFCKSYEYGTSIGTATRSGAHGWINSNGSNGEQTNIHFPTTMRATPTMSWWNPQNGTSGQFQDYNGGGAHTMGINEDSNTCITGGGTGNGDGRLNFVQWAADADY